MSRSSRLGFIRACYLVGVVADLLATVLLLVPRVAEGAFGLPTASLDGNELLLYCGRVGASLMFGWTLLLYWGSRAPIERRGILLLTVVPVLVGLIAASVAAVAAGGLALEAMLPLWVFYGLISPAFLVAWALARASAIGSAIQPQRIT